MPNKIQAFIIITMMIIALASILSAKAAMENKDKCSLILRKAYGESIMIQYDANTSPEELREKIKEVMLNVT